MLSKAAIKHVHRSVDKLFQRLKAVYLGNLLNEEAPRGIDKIIAVGHRHELSLPGLYESAVKDEGGKPDDTTLASLRAIAEGYLDAQRERMKADVLKDVNAVLKEAKASGVKTDVKTVLGGSLASTFEKATAGVTRIIDTEAQNGRAIGTLEAIGRVNALSGIDDPTVFFVIVRDGHVCEECVKLHQLHGTIDGPPRVWKTSELGHGYHKRGDASPKVGGLHPHCRCSIATLMPGYGFGEDGYVKYIGPEHDEHEKQRGFAKNDDFEWVDDPVAKNEDSESPPAAPAAPARSRGRQPKPPAPPALVAVHNLSEGNLAHSHELGGLAAPSLAIAHKDYPFDNFGEVTLVADHHLVDPQHTPVFDADIYSPRHPRAKFEVAPKELKRFQTWIEPHLKATGSDRAYKPDYDKLSDGHERAAEDRHFVLPLKHAFLSEKGLKVDPIVEEKKKSFAFSGMPALRDFFLQHGLDSTADFGGDYHKAISEAAKKAIHEHADQLPTDNEHAKNVIRDAHLDQHFNEEGLFSFGSLWRLVGDARDDGKKEVDRSATEEAMDSKLKQLGLDDEFKTWATGKLKPLEGRRYIPKTSWRYDGTRIDRKIPYNLENILKEVTKTIRQGENFNYGLGTARAAGAKKFRNLEQVKAARDKLVAPEEFKAKKEAMDERFGQLADEVREYHTDPHGFHVLDGLAQSIGESYKRGKYLHKELEENGFKGIPLDLHRKVAEFARDLVSMPTEYFEAKAQRVVGLNEFKGAVVPHDASPQTLDILRQHGLDHVEGYTRGDAKSRWEAVRRLTEAKKLMLAEGDWGDVKKAEEPLEKAEWYWNRLRPAFEAFGWRQEEGGAHTLMVNDRIPGARPVPIKRSHMNGAIDPNMVDTFYAKKMGLRVPHNGSTVIVDPKHPYAEHYAAMGLHKPEAAAGQPAMKSWTPATPHEHVPIEAVDHDEVDPANSWKVEKHKAAMASGKTAGMPSVNARENPDAPGRYYAESAEHVAAAKLSGMTHIPVTKVS